MIFWISTNLWRNPLSITTNSSNVQRLSPFHTRLHLFGGFFSIEPIPFKAVSSATWQIYLSRISFLPLGSGLVRCQIFSDVFPQYITCLVFRKRDHVYCVGLELRQIWTARTEWAIFKDSKPFLCFICLCRKWTLFATLGIVQKYMYCAKRIYLIIILL